MTVERYVYRRFADVSLEGGTFVTVFGLLDCVLLCINTKNCSSVFYNTNRRSCACSPNTYQDTTGLAPQGEVDYYRMRYGHSNDNSFHNSIWGTPTSNTSTKSNQENMKTKAVPVPTQCGVEPTYLNQGAVRKQKLSRPGYPVVIKYECDSSAKENYKYFTGPTEALCDDQGNWNLPAMFCVPTNCYTIVQNRFGRNSVVYGGDKHHEKEGRECQAWKENKPHSHKIKYTLSGACYGCGSVENTGNKCRGMAQDSKPWCYTMDRNVENNSCDVPECTTERTCARPPMLRGANAIRTELIGQKVHVTYKCHQELKYIGGGKVAICDMETGVWDWPNLLCSSEKCFYYDRGQWRSGVYHGTVSTTKTGRSCQRWDSRRPQWHEMSASKFPFIRRLSEIGNMCRDPDNEGMPWCYTTDRSTRWEFCSVPQCTL